MNSVNSPIQMAQLGSKGNGRDQVNPMETNIESPAFLPLIVKK